jgi:hypothetical protein
VIRDILYRYSVRENKFMQPNNSQPLPNGGPGQQAQAPTASNQPQTPPLSGANPNSTQNSLEIAAIRDGIVIMADGSFRAVVMAKSINFDLMSTTEQEAVEYAYQGFLNSLYFDVQILIRSRKIDMGPYLEKLAKVRNEMDNMLLSMLMEDYVYFIEDLVQQTNIMSKEFYIVVPFSGQIDAGKALQSSKKLFGGLLGGDKKSAIKIDEQSLEKAKTELTNRVQNVVNGLLQMSVQAMPLDTQELIELYYNTYNPDTATRQTLKQIESLNVPVVTKGVGHAPTPNMGGEY